MSKAKRKIVQTGNDRQIAHREDFTNCPDCDHRMVNEEWDKAGVTLILEPGIYKSGCVTVVSECPKCFEQSWVHVRMAWFDHNDAWPESWKKAVTKREDAVKLTALRQWGAGICHTCRHLESGKVDYHAWRTCIKGTGPAETTCERYEALTKPGGKK